MPWRLLIVIIIFAVFLAFISLNLDESYKCDINFGFGIIAEKVPVFLTIFISFALGVFCTLPLVVWALKKRKEKYPVVTDNEKIKNDAAEARKRFFSKRNGGNPADDGNHDKK